MSKGYGSACMQSQITAWCVALSDAAAVHKRRPIAGGKAGRSGVYLSSPSARRLVK